jgi:hypothetical protein
LIGSSVFNTNWSIWWLLTKLTKVMSPSYCLKRVNDPKDWPGTM